jgi:hypothetical protein
VTHTAELRKRRRVDIDRRHDFRHLLCDANRSRCRFVSSREKPSGSNSPPIHSIIDTHTRVPRINGFPKQTFGSIAHSSNASLLVNSLSVPAKKVFDRGREVFQRRAREDVSHEVEIDIEIVMDETIAHAADLAPLDFATAALQVVTQSLDRLADYLEVADHSILNDGLAAEIVFAIHIGANPCNGVAYVQQT